MQGVKVGARIAPNAFATADGGDCTETLGRWKRAGGFAFGQSPKRAAIIPDGGDCTETLGRWKRAGVSLLGSRQKRATIIPDSRRDVIFNTSYRRF